MKAHKVIKRSCSLADVYMLEQEEYSATSRSSAIDWLALLCSLDCIYDITCLLCSNCSIAIVLLLAH